MNSSLKKWRGSFSAVVIFLVVMTVIGMTSCTKPCIKPNSVFSPLTPKNTSALTNAVSWAKTEYSSIDDAMTKATKGVYLSDYNSAFKAANDLYKAGKFEEAKTAYVDILSDCPVHLGARNNYVLALAYCGEYENSLKNSILLGLIHPKYEGNWVNILIPLYALGYDDSSYTDSLKDAGIPDGTNLEGNYIAKAYAYNRVYVDMEAAYGKEKLAVKMKEFKDTLQALKDKSPSDTDYSELFNYLEGLAKIRSK